METKQTAVEWLYSQITFNGLDDPDGQVFEQAKEMEEDQIIASWENGFWEGCEDKLSGNCGLQYYNETYNKQDNDN